METAGKEHFSMNENERKSGGKRRVLMFILLAVFLISGALTVHQYLEDKRIQEEYERLRKRPDRQQKPLQSLKRRKQSR